MRKDRVKELLDALSKWKGRRVVVLGDLILDEFIYGTALRVSREAPVVIIRYDGNYFCPGGAANAVQNISSMGGLAIPVGVVGRDVDGRRLLKLFGKGVDKRFIVRSNEMETTKKIRVMAGEYHAQRQQVVRIDKESVGFVSVKLEKELLSLLKAALKDADALLLSDYNQGIFTDTVIEETISMAKVKGIPVIVDSRFKLGKFKGVTIATPNELEAAHAVGSDVLDIDVEKVGRKLLKLMKARAVLITMGKEGMMLFERRKRTKKVGVIGTREATDVTGAGDTVSSAVTLSLASGLDFEVAMQLANISASIVVMKRGVATASIEEIMDRIERELV